MKGVKPLRSQDAKQLVVLTALDHPLRLKAYRAIRESPGLSFIAIARRLGAKTGLAAYHLAVLKASGLVDFRYVRRSKETSSYRLTDMGELWYRRLFGPDDIPAGTTGAAQRRGRPKTGG